MSALSRRARESMNSRNPINTLPLAKAHTRRFDARPMLKPPKSFSLASGDGTVKTLVERFMAGRRSHSVGWLRAKRGGAVGTLTR